MTQDIFGIQGLYATEEEEEQARVHQQYYYNKGVQPETRVKSLRTQGEIYENQGVTLPVETIETEVDAYEQTLKDLSKMTQDFGTNRVTRRTLADLMTAPVFFDDEENMKDTEGYFKDLSDKYKIGKLNVSMAELGLKIDMGNGTIEDYQTLEKLEREQKRLSVEEYRGNFFTEMPGTIAEMAPLLFRAIQKSGKYGAVGAAAGTAVPVVGTVTGGITSMSAGTLYEFGRLEAGLSYVEMMKMKDANGRPYSPYVMGGAAGMIGLINGAIEFGSGGLLAKAATKPVKDLVKRSVMNTLTSRQGMVIMGRVGGLMAGGMLVNGGEEALQEAVNITVTELVKEYGGTPHMGFGEALQQIAAAGYTGTQAGLGFGLVPAAPFVATEMANLQRANKNRDMAAFLAGIADESKVAERMPEKQREFVKAVIKEHGAASHVGIDVESLDLFFQEAGVNEQMVEATWPEVSQSMREARETGKEVQIPMETFMQDFVKAEGIEQIMGNVRMHPEMNTDNENEVLRQSMQEVIQTLPEQEQVDTQTYSYFRNMLEKVESPEVADFQAKLLASFFTTQAANENIPVDELLARHNIDVTRTDLSEAETQAIIAEIQAGQVPTEEQMRGQSLQDFMAERSQQGMEEDQAALEAIEAGYFAETDPELVSKEEITQALQSEEPVYAYGKMDPAQISRADAAAQIAQEAESLGIDLMEGTPEEISTALLSRRLDQAAGWTEQRVTRVVDEYDQKGMVAWVHPNDFIRATVGGPAGFDAIQEETTDTDIDRVRGYADVPTLWVDEETGEIVGHEGRHRMAALFASGARKVPVIVNYRERGDRAAQGEIQLQGQQFETTKGTDITVSDAVPITWENKDQIQQQMVGGDDLLFQTATVRAGQETLEKYGLDPGQRYKTRVVAAALEARQRDKYGSIEKGDHSEEALDNISDWMVEEVLFEMLNPQQSGVGWYSEKFQRALNKMGDRFPELRTDKSARDLMTALIAITSDGQKVMPNFAMAMNIYGNFKETGQFTSDRGHSRAASIQGNLKKLQSMYEEMGSEKLHEFLMQVKTVGELNKIAREQGIKFASQYKVDVEMPMAAVIFGPKLGAFYANLMGAHGYLTMDRWWSRTFNRYRGTLLSAPTQAGLKRFRKLIGREDISDDETIAETVEPHDSYEAKGFKDGTEIEKAANTIYKKAFTELEDAPFNASDRSFMLEAVNRAQQKLAEQGHEISIADIQAILWYYEKRLYGELGTVMSADVSYEEAAEAVVEGRYDQPLKQEVGTEYFDEFAGGGQPRGYINIGPAREFFKITLTGKANLSTFLHESGHMFLEIMDQLSTDPNASAQLLTDVDTIKKWVGWKEGQQKFTRKQHEKFARGFEAYLMEGRAPSVELQSAFRRFAAWLNHIYRSIGDLQVNLTKPVRDVMDRMIASEEAIQHMQQFEQIMPVFDSPDTAGMTAEEYQEYLNDFADSMEAAEEEMRSRLISEIKRRNTREYREAKKAVTEQVTKDVLSRPVYAAIEFLRTGLLPDTNDIPANFDKLDIDTVRRMFPNDPQIIKALPRSITKKNGANPDEIAMYFGYESGHRMLVEMLNVKTAKQAIRDEVDGQMYAIHGDTFNDPDALRSEATSALHNDRISDYLVRELRLLSLKGNLPVPPGFVRQAQLYADSMVESMAVAQLRSPHRFMRAEQREAKKAMEFAATNDWERAAEAKKNQIINHWLYRKTLQAKDEADKIHRYMKHFQKPAKQAKLGKAGGSYFESAMIILEGLELRKVSAADLARRKSLASYLESIDEEGQIVQIPGHLRDETLLRNYSELSMQEFRGMYDALRNIDRLATLKNNLLRKRDLIDFNATMERVTQIIYDNQKALKTSKRQNPTAWDNMKAKFRSWDASLLKTEFLMEQLDGGTIGLIHELIYQPLVEAHDAKHKLMAEIDKTLFKRLKNLPKEQRRRLASNYDFMGTTMQGHEVLAVALNMGNEGNIDKLIRGYEDRGWSRENLMERLDEILTAEDWTLVQYIWDEIDKLWPMIVSLNESQTGLQPPRVEPVTVYSRHGTFNGGYYPVIYDPARRPKSAKDAQKKAADMFENNFMRPNVDKGFTEERTTYAAPILLSMRGLGMHINEVTHYLTHYEAVRQSYRVINDKRFAQALYDTVGKEYYDQLIPWLQNVANSSVVSGQMDPLEKFFSHMAVGTSIMAMGGSLSTGFMQLLGLSSALARLGPRYLMSGMKQAMIPGARKFAYENSKEIPHMLKNFDRDGRAVMEEMVLNVVGGKKDRLKYKHAQLVQFSFYMIGQLQQQVNIATFMGAYQKGVDNMGMSEKDAIRYGDAMMRMTQSSGAKKDLSQMQRTSGYRKLFTAFYTYFASLYGLLRSAGMEAFKGKWLQAAGQFTALILLPTFVEQLVRPDPDDETLEEWWWRYAGNVGSYVISPLPFWRDIATGLTNIATGGKYGYKFAPVGDMLSKGVVSVGRAIDPNKDLSWYDYKNIIRSMGMVFHLPVTQPLRWAEYTSAYLNGDVDEPFREFIFGVRK